jgi:hypothetical protein
LIPVLATPEREIRHFFLDPAALSRAMTEGIG